MFYRFPFKRDNILKKWVQAIRRENWVPSQASRLCSAHFKDSDYLVRPGALIRRLKPEAVPSIFNFPKHLMKNINERRVLVRNMPAIQIQPCTSYNKEGFNNEELLLTETVCAKMYIVNKIVFIHFFFLES